MSLNIIKFILIKNFLVLFFKTDATTAEIVIGSCETINYSPFNCTILLKMQQYETKHFANYHISAILKPLQDFGKNNIFDFDRNTKDLSSSLILTLKCGNQKFIRGNPSIEVACLPLENRLLDMKNIELGLKLERNFSLTVISSDNCPNKNILDKNFHLFMYGNPNVLVFHGCKTLNETHMDLGLMFLTPTHKTITNINETLNNTLVEMKLGSFSALERKMIFIENRFGSKISKESQRKCENPGFFIKYHCNRSELDFPDKVFLFALSLICLYKKT